MSKTNVKSIEDEPIEVLRVIATSMGIEASDKSKPELLELLREFEEDDDSRGIEEETESADSTSLVDALSGDKEERERRLETIVRLAKREVELTEILAEARKQCNADVRQARKALNESIESPASSDPLEVLRLIRASYQLVEEEELRRSETVKPIREALAAVKKSLRSEIENIDQLNLKF